jgi:hypothetical protein
MFAILYALGMAVADLVKSRARLEAETLLLRHQLTRGARSKDSTPRRHDPAGEALCVPKTSSGLIRGGNRLTSADHDRADLPHLVGLDRPVQVEEPA